MTAESFAELVHGRPVGRGKWVARCVAHDDRHPSLSITQGREAVLLTCWSHGCTPRQIVAVLGLRMADLFLGPPSSPATRCELELRRAKQALEASRQRRRRIALMNGYRACSLRMVEIAHAFFNSEPEKTNELGPEFHDCVEFLRAVEMEVPVGHLR